MEQISKQENKIKITKEVSEYLSRKDLNEKLDALNLRTQILLKELESLVSEKEGIENLLLEADKFGIE